MTTDEWIVHLLGDGPRSARRLAMATGHSVSTVRSRLLEMERLGIVRGHRDRAKGRVYWWELVRVCHEQQPASQAEL